jgi:hypothetical protein
MKLFLIIGLAIVALCAYQRDAQNTISTSPPAGAPGNEASEDVEKKIIQLERDWGDALAKRDLMALDRILGWADGDLAFKIRNLKLEGRNPRRSLFLDSQLVLHGTDMYMRRDGR